MLKKLSIAAGMFCLIFSFIPLLGYGIFNVGVGSLLLAGALFIVLPCCWKKLSRRLRSWIAFGAWVGMLFVATISGLMVRQAWFNPPPDDALPVIVLGGKIYGDQPSRMLRYRLNAAADYLHEQPQAVCVVSGGQGPDESQSEASVMAAYLVNSGGIAPERIFLEDKSTNTRQNLQFSGQLLGGAQSVVIATDSFHQLRASIFAKAEGMTAHGLPSPTPWGLLPAYWVRDVLGVAFALVTT